MARVSKYRVFTSSQLALGCGVFVKETEAGALGLPIHKSPRLQILRLPPPARQTHGFVVNRRTIGGKPRSAVHFPLQVHPEYGSFGPILIISRECIMRAAENKKHIEITSARRDEGSLKGVQDRPKIRHIFACVRC